MLQQGVRQAADATEAVNSHPDSDDDAARGPLRGQHVAHGSGLSAAAVAAGAHPLEAFEREEAERERDERLGRKAPAVGRMSSKVVPDGGAAWDARVPAASSKSRRTLVGRLVSKVFESEEYAEPDLVADEKTLEDMRREAALAAMSQELAEQQLPRFVLNPNGTFRNRWDMIVIFALTFVATVTPYEVAFVEQSNTLLTVCNRLIDVVFCIDIVLNFVTPFQTTAGTWVVTHSGIAYHYASSWFIVDLVSVLPFEMLRMVRLLRLAKLLRIFRASRVLKRWETRVSISYGYITLGKFVIYMIFLSHWLACLFRLVPTMENGSALPEDFTRPNWVEGYFVDNLGYDSVDQVSESDQYNAALYWAVMTVTTIGYGDVVGKSNAERWVAISAMMIGGAAYAYIVGSVCGLVASMGEFTARLHRKVDDLNAYMHDVKLPQPMRVKLREYFHYIAKQYRQQHYRILLEEMSPEMRSDVFRRVNEEWVMRLPFVSCASEFERKGVVSTLAALLHQEIFPPRERIARPGELCKTMYVIERGVIMMNKSYFVPPELSDAEHVAVKMTATLATAKRAILTRGCTFGEDMVLSKQRRKYLCMSFTYVELHSLSRRALFGIFDEDAFPDTHKALRKHIIKMAFQKRFVSFAQSIKTRRLARREQQRRHDERLPVQKAIPKDQQEDVATMSAEIQKIRAMLDEASSKLSKLVQERTNGN